MTRTKQEIQHEITAGEQLAVKIKKYYYADQPWSPKLALEIGYKMGEIKKKARKIYECKDMIQILHELATFEKEDLEDLLAMK